VDNDDDNDNNKNNSNNDTDLVSIIITTALYDNTDYN